MLKGHPTGLAVLFLSNMGERFGYYTMLSIFALFLEARFGLSEQAVGSVYGNFLFAVYFLPLFGGWVADRIGYARVVLAGLILMLLGYVLMAVPFDTLTLVYGSLLVVALGTGLFKGNLVVLLGNLYDKEPFKALHGAAFNIFYMGINVGAFFSPYAATGIRDWTLARAGFAYDARIPGLAHQLLAGNAADSSKLTSLVDPAVLARFTDLKAFAAAYVDALARGYNAGFAIAAGSVVVSLCIFLALKKHYAHADIAGSRSRLTSAADDLTPEQTRARLGALVLVFFVVIFFWTAFHQSGLTLTWFAKNYTVGAVDRLTKVLFDLPALLSCIAAIIGAVYLVKPASTPKVRGLGAALVAAGLAVAAWRFTGFGETNAISPELFQSFNPIFVVFLTPVVIALWARVAARGKEPSAPRKIMYGMALAGGAYLVMVAAAQGLASPAALKPGGGVSDVLLSPYWLISTYLALTVAELLLSPMGLAFVARVAPPRYRGLMQGGWLAATAVGNKLAGAVSIPYERLELWQTFGLLVVTSLVSAALIAVILKRLEAATS